jgi:Outer membrane protein beta-barrel domain
MKRTILYVVVGILFTKNLVAQDRLKHVTFDVGGGFSFPTGQLANRADTGFGLVASGGPRFSPSLSIGLDFAIQFFNVENRPPGEVTVPNFTFGAMVRTWSLTVNPTYQFLRRERSSYYATAGYGLYNRQLQDLAHGAAAGNTCDAFWNVCVSNSPTGSSLTGNVNPYRGGYNVGGGVNFGSRTKLFVEVRYHHMFTSRSPTELIPVTFGVRW